MEKVNVKLIAANLCIIFFFILPNNLTCQSNYYKIDWKKDGYIMGGSILFWGGTFYLKDKADKATEADLLLLNRNDIWGFDRGATNQLSTNSKSISDYILLGSVALPALLMIDKLARKEGVAIGIMSLEAMIITNGLTNFLKATTKRFRPFTYNPEVPITEKLTRSARFSFLSGHASNVSTISFLSVKILTDLHPDSKLKPLIWSVGVAIPAAAGYFRYKAGRHFPTDIIFGYALGAVVGYMIPVIHHNENLDLLIGERGSLGLRYAF